MHIFLKRTFTMFNIIEEQNVVVIINKKNHLIIIK